MAERTWARGDVLAGKYRLARELGRGGMGSVWQAEHLVLRSPIAIKLIRGRGEESAALEERFSREAQAAAALRSPHVVQILDYGVHEGTPFMVMELLEGESLAQRLRRVGRLDPRETAWVVAHVARAIHKAHEAGIVHRDLKPDNVFLVHNADEEIAKVLDFGIAKSLTGDDPSRMATQTGAVLGTPHYMSPEQARGTRAVDHRADLWALGVITFECLTGSRPFESTVLGDLLLKICAEPPPQPSSLAPVPQGFDQWFSRAVERDPDRRFQSAMEMAEAFKLVAGGTALSIPPAPYSGATVPFGPGAGVPSQGGFTEPSSPNHPLPSSPVAARTAPVDPAQYPGVVHPAPPSLATGSPKGFPVGVVALGALGLFALLGVAGFALVLYLGPNGSSDAPAAPTPSIVPSGEPSVELAPTKTSSGGARRSTRSGVTPSAAQTSDDDDDAPEAKSGGDSGSTWQTDVAKAQADAKKAQDDAKKAQDDAAKARAEAEALRKKALEGLPK